MVPGVNWRYGRFICDLPFDNFVKVEIDGEIINGKSKNVLPFFYLAHREDVEFL